MIDDQRIKAVRADYRSTAKGTLSIALVRTPRRGVVMQMRVSQRRQASRRRRYRDGATNESGVGGGTTNAGGGALRGW